MNRALTKRTLILWLGGYGLFFCLVLLICPWIGGETIDYRSLWQRNWTIDSEILFFQRIPRVLLAALVGGALAVVGAAFQVILHNPLAEPYTLGITGGGSVGAVLAITVPWFAWSWGPFSTIQLCSLLGSGAILYMIYTIARRPEGVSTSTLLLAGVTISILSAGMIMFIRYFASPHYLMEMDRWFMGGVDVVGYNELSALFPLLMPGLWLLFSCVIELNHLSLGEEIAFGHGVDVHAVHQRVFLGGGLTTAAVVSMAGPIGFVGLIIPHAVRYLSGYDHRIVLPASFFGGGSFLVLCDTVARTILSPMEMPVGIITAMIGGPMFILILLKKKGIE
ncbi:MAG: iron ABC transporter permease [bacterium]|jgi:iron complex transport system permease protein|nr:iron ABC transporter permease [bacterium]